MTSKTVKLFLHTWELLALNLFLLYPIHHQVPQMDFSNIEQRDLKNIKNLQ